MKNFFLVLVILLAGVVCSSAQSTVYFFMRSSSNSTCTMKLNGKEVFDMRGPLQKTQKAVGPMIYPLQVYSPSKRKCTFKNKGKMLFTFDMKYKVPTTGEVKNYLAEIQLNLTESSVHYVRIGAKGLNDVQFKELTQKEGEKLLKDKKYVFLPDYVEK